eukprot:scaffold84678_cov64-Phaeocystis_antarctica.AAC.8
MHSRHCRGAAAVRHSDRHAAVCRSAHRARFHTTTPRSARVRHTQGGKHRTKLTFEARLRPKCRMPSCRFLKY